MKAPTGPSEENFLVVTDGELDDDGVAITTPLARNNCPEDFSKKICFHVTAGLERDGLTRDHHDRRISMLSWNVLSLKIVVMLFLSMPPSH